MNLHSSATLSHATYFLTIFLAPVALSVFSVSHANVYSLMAAAAAWVGCHCAAAIAYCGFEDSKTLFMQFHILFTKNTNNSFFVKRNFVK